MHFMTIGTQMKKKKPISVKITIHLIFFWIYVEFILELQAIITLLFDKTRYFYQYFNFFIYHICLTLNCMVISQLIYTFSKNHNQTLFIFYIILQE